MEFEDFPPLKLKFEETKDVIKKFSDEVVEGNEGNRNETEYHVSNLVGKCLRKDVIDIYFPDNNYKPTVKKIFTLGKAIHEHIQSILKEKYKSFIPEYEIKINNVIIAHVDGLINNNTVLEIKTTFKWDTAVMNLSESWLKQLFVYMSFLDVDKGILLVVPLNPKMYREYTFTLTSEERKTIREYMLSKIEFIKNLKPKNIEDILNDSRIFRLYQKTSPECSLCPYKNLCYQTNGKSRQKRERRFTI